MMPANTQVLSPEVLAKLKGIQFRMRSLVTELFAGEYVSAFKGRGMEFEEVRPYQPGDDVRAIDWNVTARTGTPFLKIYREERELTLLFLVDVSASMRFGSVRQFKSEMAAEATALLAYAALKSNDKIGLVIFSDHVEHYLPPKKGRAHIWRVIRDILTHRSKATKTDLKLPLEFLNRVAKRRVVAFLISDFLGGGYDQVLRRTARHHDLVAISIDDPREKHIPNVGLIELRDAETGRLALVNTRDGALRRQWQESFSSVRARRDRLFRQSGVDHIALGTEGSAVDPLVQFFRRRERRR
ncbi:MAG TPA: DUF58 domain-containing protein [bacterium]|nr:DUF58 domain-containing protein [bacterium]